MELDITKWDIALSEVQFPNNFYTIREGHNTVIKEYISPSTDELNSIYNNTESNIKKEELANIKITVLEQDYVYREIIEVLPDIYGSIEQILSQLRNNEIRSVKSIDYIYHPITRKVYINLVQKCRLDFNNSDVGYCLGYNPDEVLISRQTSHSTEYC